MKKLFCTILTILCVSSIFALPGISSVIEDTSGEYVYYLDTSMDTPSLVGFIYYNPQTYAARFYNEANEKDISIYITINPESSTLEFTGEKIIGAKVLEDANIVNYLHDMFYEFTSRRKKIEGFSKSSYVSEENFPQFYGNVRIKFNQCIPLFNLESIQSVDGNILFSLFTMGQLVSSDDQSFAQFKGVNGLTDEKKIKALPKDAKRKFKLKKAKSSSEYTYNSQKVTLDSGWAQSLDNLFFLGNAALITLTDSTFPQDISFDTQKVFLERKFSQSTNLSYALYNYRRFECTENTINLTNIYFQPETKNVTRDIKVLKRISDTTWAMFNLTVFDSVYQKHKKYFDSIVDSYLISE